MRRGPGSRPCWPPPAPSLVVAALLAALTACGEDRPAREPAPPFTPAEAAAPRAARAPAPPEGRWRTARVLRRTQLRARPGGRVVATLDTRTEFGSTRVLGVVRRRGAWLQVVATERRSGAPGWIPAEAARLGATDLAIHIDRSARRLTLRRDGRAVRRFAVAVGRPGAETPLGRFAVTDRLRPQRADSPYGCCAIALSGHQPKLLPGWPGGDRLAIHATPQVESVGQAASLGCLRGRPSDVRRLMRAIPLGTPVFIRA